MSSRRSDASTPQPMVAAARRGPSRRKPGPTDVAGKRMTPPKTGVKVRMYRTGLGDCFLLAFPKARPAAGRDAVYVLVDCGVFMGTPGSKEKMRAVAADIRDATGGRLDVLVITHEHWDHVSAF